MKEKPTSKIKKCCGVAFDPEIIEHAGMRQLVEIVEFQKWSHLFETQSPKVYEEEVQNFYVGPFMVDGATLCLKINVKDFVLDENTLGEILEVPTYGMRPVEGTGSPNFKKLIMKKLFVLSGEKVCKKTLQPEYQLLFGERVYKKSLQPEYQLLFELVNKVLLPRVERRSISSIVDLVLLDALHPSPILASLAS